MDPPERARRLVALATNAGASSEEARTAAMAACRLIAKHKLLDAPATRAVDGAARRASSRERTEPDGTGPRRRARRDAKGTSYRAAGTGTCAFCAKAFGPEGDVMTYVDGSVDHWHCAKRRAAGGDPVPR
jgi:hypothetical protein